MSCPNCRYYYIIFASTYYSKDEYRFGAVFTVNHHNQKVLHLMRCSQRGEVLPSLKERRGGTVPFLGKSALEISNET